MYFQIDWCRKEMWICKERVGEGRGAWKNGGRKSLEREGSWLGGCGEKSKDGEDMDLGWVFGWVGEMGQEGEIDGLGSYGSGGGGEGGFVA